MHIATKKAINFRLRKLLSHLEEEIKHWSDLYEFGGNVQYPAPYCQGKAEMARELYEYVNSMILPEKSDE